MLIAYSIHRQQQRRMTMRYSTASTRYQAMKNNPDCFSFYKVEGGFACFYCAQSLAQWLNQK